MITEKIFKSSKAVHKYLGIIVIIYFIFMAVTGIIINHKSIVEGINIPSAIIPEQYNYKNWNKMLCKDSIISPEKNNNIYIGGKQGVWKTHDNGKTFTPLKFDDNLRKDTNTLLLADHKKKAVLFAGTETGLFYFDSDNQTFKKVKNSLIKNKPIKDLIIADENIFAFTQSEIFSFSIKNFPDFIVNETDFTASEAVKTKVSLFSYLKKLHGGAILGLPGKLFVDLIGISILFLSISAFYIWFFPWKKKYFKKKTPLPYFIFFHKNHLKIGIYTSVFIILIAITGIFLRPPFIMMIIKTKLPLYLDPLPNIHSIFGEIKKAAFLKDENKILIYGKNGFFKGPAKEKSKFEKININIPVHFMGVEVLKSIKNNQILVGSFAGLFLWNIKDQKAFHINGKLVDNNMKPLIKPSKNMVVAAGISSGKLLFFVDYKKGIQSTENIKIQMPENKQIKSMSLWKFCYDCHNGRIFQGFLGKFTWLVIPIGGIIFLLEIITGIYDWFYKTSIKPNNRH